MPGDARAVLAGSHGREAPPAAADLEHVIAGAELELLADAAELAQLGILERLVVALEERAGVRHRLVQEEREQVVAEVVVVFDVPPRPHEAGRGGSFAGAPRGSGGGAGAARAPTRRSGAAARRSATRSSESHSPAVYDSPSASLARVASRRKKRELRISMRTVGPDPKRRRRSVRQPHRRALPPSSSGMTRSRIAAAALPRAGIRTSGAGRRARSLMRAPTPFRERTAACGGTGRASARA